MKEEKDYSAAASDWMEWTKRWSLEERESDDDAEEKLVEKERELEAVEAGKVARCGSSFANKGQRCILRRRE